MFKQEVLADDVDAEIQPCSILWNHSPFDVLLPVRRSCHIVKTKRVSPASHRHFDLNGWPSEMVLLREFKIKLIGESITLAAITNAPEAECELPDHIHTSHREIGTFHQALLEWKGREDRSFVSARITTTIDRQRIQRLLNKGGLSVSEPFRKPESQTSQQSDPVLKQQEVVAMSLQLAQELDSNPKIKAPNHLTVFRLYCVEDMTVHDIEKQCACSHGTVINRKKTLEAKLGANLDSFKKLSGIFEEMTNSLDGARSSKVYRKGLTGS
ncbi:MAG: hypothetical protein V2A34_11455 [Lentisphaerota bacterium]